MTSTTNNPTLSNSSTPLTLTGHLPPSGNTNNTNSQLPGSSPWINKLKIIGSGQHWAVAACGPFYLMSAESANDASLTGSTNLIEHYGLANAYHKLCGKRLGQELSTFLPTLSGDIDVPADNDASGLQVLIERPPICGKEIVHLSQPQAELAFRLHPGPLPPKFSSLFSHTSSNQTTEGASPRKREHRKRRRDVSREPFVDSLSGEPGAGGSSAALGGGSAAFGAAVATSKGKRPRRSDEEEKRKKKKKDKKRKRIEREGDAGGGVFRAGVE